MKCCLFRRNKKYSKKVFQEDRKTVSPPINTEKPNPFVPKEDFVEINEHQFSLRVAEKEGGKKSISIAQIKEVQKILLDELAEEWQGGNRLGVEKLIEKHLPK